MNIFATDQDPNASAKVLPDKHIVKMPLECCQMLAIIYSSWYYDWGPIPKKDGGYYATAKGAFRNHPSTKWAAQNIYNTAWLIQHGCCLASEYQYRYNKIHSCAPALLMRQKRFFTVRQRKQSLASVWQKTSPVLCLMSGNMMTVLIPLLHTRDTLLPNPG